MARRTGRPIRALLKSEISKCFFGLQLKLCVFAVVLPNIFGCKF